MSLLINATVYSNATASGSLSCDDHPVEIFWRCISAGSFVFGFPGAVAILVDMFQRGRKGTPFTPNDVFMFNLTVMNGLYLLIRQPHIFIPHNTNIVYEALISFLYSFNLCGRPLFVTCICLECYLAVVHPLIYRTRKSLTLRVLMAVGVWTTTVAYGCYLVISVKGKSDLIPIIFLILTLPVIGFCDVSILWTLMRCKPGGKDVHPQKKKALQIVFYNLVIGFFSYLPPLVGWMIPMFTKLDKITFTNCVLVPIMSTTVIGNTMSIILQLNNLGKLDWIKCWEQK